MLAGKQPDEDSGFAIEPAPVSELLVRTDRSENLERFQAWVVADLLAAPLVPLARSLPELAASDSRSKLGATLECSGPVLVARMVPEVVGPVGLAFAMARNCRWQD
jgi:hypothetical protein